MNPARSSPDRSESRSSLPFRASLACFYANSGLAISFLVFLNAAQPFVLSDILDVPKGQLGRAAGSLVFADELLGIAMVLVWGRLADSYLSPRSVSALGNLIIGLSFLLFVEARNVYPQLLLARLLFAMGSAAVTAMLSALLSFLIAERPVHPVPTSSETDPLLDDRRALPDDQTSTTISAFLGLSTGLGALLAVFVFLRLPNTLFRSLSPTLALKWSFRLVAAIALANSALAYYGLPRTQTTGRRSAGSLLKELKSLVKGFELAWKDEQVALGYFAAFVARAQNIAVNAFVPLYVAHYFVTHGLCGKPIDGIPGDIKSGCRPAYSFASALTGVINLTALLIAPFLSLVRGPPARFLSGTAALGALAFLALCRGRGRDSDPRSALSWVAALGIGVAQMTAVVLSLGMVGAARRRLLAGGAKQKPQPVAQAQTQSEHEQPEEKVEIAGALAGASSFCGGCGILFVSGLGSILPVSGSPGLPFMLVAGANVVLSIAAGTLAVRLRRRESAA